MKFSGGRFSSKKKIALNRPGAIGDCLMILNLMPKLRKKYPDYTIDFYTKTTGIEQIMLLSGIDNILDSDLINVNSHEYERIFNLIGYPVLTENYPNNGPIDKHLLEYFAIELGLEVDKHNLPRFRIVMKPIINTDYITIHPFTGWSIYKEWGIEKWEQVVKAFPDKQFIQIGVSTDRKIAGCNHSFMNVSLMKSINLIANAKLHLGGDSFSNHITHMANTPAIILWGSTQVSASGYEKNTNINLDLSCQPCWKENEGISTMTRGKCEYNHACMAGITVDMVVQKIKEAVS